MTTKERLLQAAGMLFAEHGFDGVSVRDIVREAHANLGAVTYHFGGKEGLFAAVIDQKVAPLRDIFAEVARSHLGPREKLSRLLLETALHIFHKDPSLKVLFMEAMAGGDRLPENAHENLEHRNRVVREILQEGIERGEFRPCDVESVAWIFFGMLMPYVMHQPIITPERRRGPYPEEDVKRMVESALDIFFQGLERREGSA